MPHREAIGAGLDGGVHDCAARASKLGTEITGLNLEF